MSNQRTKQTINGQVHQEGLPEGPDITTFDRAPQQVRIIAGPDVQDLDLAGRTVAEARAVAQAVFGIDVNADALVDGCTARADQVLAAGQELEFTRQAGEKGALPSRKLFQPSGPSPAAGRGTTVELSGQQATWQRDGQEMAKMPLRDLVNHAARQIDGAEHWRLHPRNVRLMTQRHDVVTGVIIEMPPGPRAIGWIADDEQEPFGPETTYNTRRLSFPWVELFVVFTNGELSNVQQAFFRTTPIESLDDDLSFTCLLNVAVGYNMESWVCLQNLRRKLRRLTWEQRIAAVTTHFWQARYNRSSDYHEENSYWESMRGKIDRRLDSVGEWEEATRVDPYFTLGVSWPRTPRTVGQTLARMLDMVAPCEPVERVEQVVTLMQRKG